MCLAFCRPWLAAVVTREVWQKHWYRKQSMFLAELRIAAKFCLHDASILWSFVTSLQLIEPPKQMWLECRSVRKQSWAATCCGYPLYRGMAWSQFLASLLASKLIAQRNVKELPNLHLGGIILESRSLRTPVKMERAFLVRNRDFRLHFWLNYWILAWNRQLITRKILSLARNDYIQFAGFFLLAGLTNGSWKQISVQLEMN